MEKDKRDELLLLIATPFGAAMFTNKFSTTKSYANIRANMNGFIRSTIQAVAETQTYLIHMSNLLNRL